ncbi:UNVERIFIED_CONTAM: hypothetical protein GTU68_002500, partial [Idotea baltica]|nr:hypothetical protein [Idotea baltica]
SLILHKRISTTVAKAKALRKYVEPLITKSKSDTTHSRRVVFRYLQNKESIKELFGLISDRVGDRPGGYTRILKTGFREGDSAEMCIIELVDFNETYTTTKEKKKTRRRKKKTTDAAATTTKPAETAADVVEEVVTDVEETTSDIVADASDAVEDTASEDENKDA